MTGIFRQKTPGNIILLILLGIFIKLPTFFHAKGFIVKQSDGVFYTGLTGFLARLTNSNAFIFTLIAFILNILIALILSSFINTDRFMNKPNFLSGMAYILITSFLPSFNLFSSNLVASALLLIAFKLMYQSHHLKNNIFNAALLVGIASLFFFPAIFFVAWALLALLVLRSFRVADWILLFLGLSSPYYFYGTYLFLNDRLEVPAYFYQLSFLSSDIRYTLWHATALFLLLAPLLAGIYYMQANSAKMLVHIRKGWYLFLAYLGTAIIIALFDIESSSENLVPALVPIAAFHGYGYLNAELKGYPKVAFWVTVAFVIVNQLYGNLW